MAKSVPTTDEVVVAKKRAPRKRVVKATDDSETTDPKPRARRPRAAKVTETETIATAVPVHNEPPRRAPTPLRSEKAAYNRSRRVLVSVGGFLVVVLVAAFFIGTSDQGPIDVVAVVNERNERVGRGEMRDGETSFTVPVQNSDTRANGGLVPVTETTPPAPDPVVATTTVDTTVPTSTTETTTASTSSDATSETEAPAAVDESVTDDTTDTEIEGV